MVKSITRSGNTFTAKNSAGTALFTFDQKDDNSTYPDAIKNITRSGTTFTATRYSGGTFTFTQQDNNNTYDIAVRNVEGTVAANSQYVQITAPAVSGYTFKIWTAASTSGWVSWCYLQEGYANPTKI